MNAVPDTHGTVPNVHWVGPISLTCLFRILWTFLIVEYSLPTMHCIIHHRLTVFVQHIYRIICHDACDAASISFFT